MTASFCTPFEQDLIGIFKNANTSEIMEAISQSIICAGQTTFKSKKEALRNTATLANRLFRAAGNKIRDISYRVKNTGWQLTVLGEITDAASAMGDKGRQVAEGFRRFRDMPAEEKKQQLAWGLSATLAALGTAGGLDAEGGVPDMDIAVFGIGGHRSIFFHSILAGFGTEFLIRFTFGLCRRLKHRLPAPYHPIWNQFFDLSDKIENGAVAGSWFGIAAHLFQDAGLFSASIKPYSDIPFHMTMDGHQAALAGNAGLAGIFSLDDGVKKAIGAK